MKLGAILLGLVTLAVVAAPWAYDRFKPAHESLVAVPAAPEPDMPTVLVPPSPIEYVYPADSAEGTTEPPQPITDNSAVPPPEPDTPPPPPDYVSSYGDKLTVGEITLHFDGKTGIYIEDKTGEVAQVKYIGADPGGPQFILTRTKKAHALDPHPGERARLIPATPPNAKLPPRAFPPAPPPPVN